jgi:hypothetical protein
MNAGALLDISIFSSQLKLKNYAAAKLHRL